MRCVPRRSDTRRSGRARRPASRGAAGKMLDGLDVALTQLLTVESLTLVLIGLVIGTAAAILPGVSPATMMALLLPFTFTMDTFHSFMFLVALMASAGFAGSMTSILINVPGDGINAATCLDGYPLARKGKAGVAIGASAAASGLGMIFGLAVLVLALPIVGKVILAFGPAEFFALSVLGVSLIAVVSTGSPLKGLMAGIIGMILGFVGNNVIVGGTRYTFGVLELSDGISLVPALIGLFAFPELFDLMRSNQTISREGMTVSGGVWEGALEVLRRPALFIRSSILGTLMGLMPGVGQSIAAWVSYYAAAMTSKEPETFGKGNVEGVIAPEATIDAKEAASMLPVLVFGLPAGVSSAILLSAFQLHGIVPGQQLLTNNGALVWVMILTMFVCSQSTSIMGFLFANWMVKITLVPVAVLAPIIYVIGLVGSYAEQGSLFGVVLAVVFGVFGILMTRYGFPRAPLLVGLILVPLAEKNFYQAFQLSRSSYEFLLRPITFGVLLFTVAAVVFPFARQQWMRHRPKRDEGIARAVREAVVAAGADEGTARVNVGEVVFTGLLALAVLVLVQQTLQLDPKVRIFPTAVLGSAVVLIGTLLVRALRAWRRGTGRAVVEDRRRAALSLGWLLAYPVLVVIGGLVASAVVYTALFATTFAPRELSRRRIVVGATTAAAMGALVFYVFGQGLGLRLYMGIFG